MSDILLETHALTKQFRKHKAVDEINMHIKRGGIYGFIGRNGAGKTTFLKMISGLTTPSSGDYSLFGYSGKELSKVRSRVGCLAGLAKERNITILISSHILEELSKVCTDFGIIHKGNLLQELSQEQLMQQCSKRIELVLDEPKKAVVTLDEIGVHDYEVIDKSHIYIYERLEESAYINERLVNSGVCPREIKVNQEELESYFLNMTAD